MVNVRLNRMAPVGHLCLAISHKMSYKLFDMIVKDALVRDLSLNTS